MKEKDIKSMENGELLNKYVIAVMDYEENPDNKENKFKMIEMNLEILKRME